jgi:sugar phosphate isomerase/epimerase
MKNKYPCYRVMNPWSENMIFHFEKSRAGFEAAIEFAKENNCNYVTCLTSANAKPEIAWESDPKSFGGAMTKAAEKSQVIKLRGVNGAPITSYKQTNRP